MSELNNIQIIEIARLCHAANTELQVVQGDPNPSKPWDELDDQMRQSIIKGVRLSLEGASAEKMHESWRLQKIEDGWTLGDVKDLEKKTHPNLVYYEHLPLSEKLKDFIFNGIVEGYAAAHGLGAKGLAAMHPVGESSDGAVSDRVLVRQYEKMATNEGVASEQKLGDGVGKPFERRSGDLSWPSVSTEDLVNELRLRGVRQPTHLKNIPLVQIIEFVQGQGYVVQEEADYNGMFAEKVSEPVTQTVEWTVNVFNKEVTNNYNTNYPAPAE